MRESKSENKLSSSMHSTTVVEQLDQLRKTTPPLSLPTVEFITTRLKIDMDRLKKTSHYGRFEHLLVLLTC
jgi:hypothetical protein